MSEQEPQDEPRKCRVPTGLIAAAGGAAAAAALLSRLRPRAWLRAHAQALQEMAVETGCAFTEARPGTPAGPDFPSLDGTTRNRTVRVDTEVAGPAWSYRLLTRATATHSAAVNGFVVIRGESLLTRMADHLGLSDIQVGEPAFDRRFEVTSDLPDAARLLQPEVRDALMTAAFESVVVRQDAVTVRQLGPVRDKDALGQLLKLAVDIAEWLEMLD